MENGDDQEPLQPGGMFTRAELQEMIGQMDAAAHAFYGRATRIHHHAFIEFTGLMTEYIKLCRVALDNGVDFTRTNVHSAGAVLPMEDYHRAYLEEKLSCIYGVSLDALMFPENASLPRQILGLCALRVRRTNLFQWGAPLVDDLVWRIRRRFEPQENP
jgi:hypothetical protein